MWNVRMRGASSLMPSTSFSGWPQKWLTSKQTPTCSIGKPSTITASSSAVLPRHERGRSSTLMLMPCSFATGTSSDSVLRNALIHSARSGLSHGTGSRQPCIVKFLHFSGAHARMKAAVLSEAGLRLLSSGSANSHVLPNGIWMLPMMTPPASCNSAMMRTFSPMFSAVQAPLQEYSMRFNLARFRPSSHSVSKAILSGTDVAYWYMVVSL